MTTRSFLSSIIVLAFALAMPGWAFSQDTSVSGTVSDSENGMPLVGANVLHVESMQGTATDEVGAYILSGLPAGTNTIRVSYTGYRTVETEIEISEGEEYLLNVELVSGIDLDQLQITASRRQEKVLDSPSSTDVILAQDLRGVVTHGRGHTTQCCRVGHCADRDRST